MHQSNLVAVALCSPVSPLRRCTPVALGVAAAVCGTGAVGAKQRAGLRKKGQWSTVAPHGDVHQSSL